MADTIVQPVRYPYDVKFIPRRGRKFRSATVAAQDFIMLRRAALSETRAVFRISGQANQDRLLPPRQYEILLFENDLWWPVVDASGPMRVEDFLAGLEVGRPASLRYVLKWPILSETRRSVDDLIAREIGESTQGEVRALLHKSAAETLLCGDLVFRRGGEPVYICPLAHRFVDCETDHVPEYLSQPRGEICTVDSMSAVDMLRSSSGPIFRSDFADCIEYGSVFRADELEMALALNPGEGRRMFATATVEMLDGAPIHIDPVALQVDDFVRRLNKILDDEKGSHEIASHHSLAPIVSEFRHLALRGSITKEAGLAAIKDFSHGCSREKVPANSRLHYSYKLSEKALDLINAHCIRRGVEPFSRLDDDEDAALASFAS